MRKYEGFASFFSASILIFLKTPNDGKMKVWKKKKLKRKLKRKRSKKVIGKK